MILLKILNQEYLEDKILNINSIKKNEIKNKIGIIYLYYDNFNTNKIKTEPLDYEYEDGNIIINHKHPLSIKTKHIYLL